MLAGGIGGSSGDVLMHSLDTVKTRQQGDPHLPPKYTTLSNSYATIFRQEGVRRGLYGGFGAMMLGSFPGTFIFFGCYEYCKRQMLDYKVNASIAYLTSGRSRHAESVSCADSGQGLLPILQLLSSTSPPKYLRPVSNSREDTTIHSSIQATTIDQRGMLPKPSPELKD